MDELPEEHEGNFVASVKEMSEWDSGKKGTLRKLIVEPEDPKSEEGKEAVEEAEEDSVEEDEDDPVEEVLQDNEFHEIFKLIARDELKNCERKKASSFLAKELSGSSRESAMQQSVKPPTREEGEDAVEDSEEDSVDDDDDDPVDEGEEDSVEEGEDDPVEEVLQDNEFHEIFKLIARDELKNCERKKASSFLAKELSGYSRESAVQQSVKPPKRDVKPPKREEGEDAVEDSEEDSVDDDDDDSGDEAEEDSVEEGEDDPVEEVLQDNEFHEIFKLIARDELKNCERKKASSFLAKELPGSSRESAVQQSVKPVSTVEGFTKRRTVSGTESLLTSGKDWKRLKTPSRSDE